MADSGEIPAGLQAAGQELWLSIAEDYELDRHEALLLREACRVVDRLDRLNEAALTAPVTTTNRHGDLVCHPAQAEARAQAIVLSRLLASLRLPSGEQEARPQRRGAARGAYPPRRLGSVS